jgi:NAD(P)-dependent dehydrogenase (short-subunit alcohol dehydrogenase family)
MGLSLLHELAVRGAHIIALSPVPIELPKIDILINLLRTTTNNEQIFAEECDLTSPNSVHDFCTKFLTGQEHRLDAIIFAHEYQHIGPFFSHRSTEALEKERRAASLATFLATTLLLPALLVAPVERDIRIINVINPFYAAAVPTFSPSFDALPSWSSRFLLEGRRALRMAVFTRHLQRVLDALPSGGQVPKTDDNANTIPVISEKSQKSNIVAISVCPGISRSDIIAPLLNADLSVNNSSMTGAIMYVPS